MSQLDIADNNGAAHTDRVSSAYVPSLQRTEGQPPLPEGVLYDPRERDRKENLLPGRDSRQRRPADSGRIQRRHHRVMQGEACDEEKQ